MRSGVSAMVATNLGREATQWHGCGRRNHRDLEMAKALGTIALDLVRNLRMPRCEAANWIAIGSCNIFNDWRRGHELGSSGHPKTMGSLSN